MRRRRRLPPSAYAWWGAALLLAVVTGLVVAGAVGRAARAGDRYGRARPVLVATADLDPGDQVDAAHTDVRSLPDDLVAAGALRSLPTGNRSRTVVAPIARGEPILAVRLGAGSAHGPTALMPPGSRAVAVPVPVDGLPLAPGDHVDLLSPGSDGRRGGLVARHATVIAVEHGATTVAVGPDEAPAVAEALGAGNVVIALRSG